MPARAGAKAIVKKIVVSSTDPKSEPASGGRNQALAARRREKMVMSSNCPITKAAAEATAMRWVVAEPPSGFQGSGW
ncbi:hypothetical protein D3C86_1953440 [compost metagenome]